MKMTERLKRLVRMQSISYSLERALEINSLSLDNVKEIASLKENPGWKMLSEQMVKDMANKSEKIIALSIDPVKNATEILFHRAVLETIKRIHNLVEQTTTKIIPLRRERDELIKHKEALNA